MHKKSIFIGTSGWSYKHWTGNFYPNNLKAKEYLKYYAEQFSSVEINSSFYHSLKDQTVKNWVKAVPENFVFAVKADRYITHMKKLEDAEETVPGFIKTLKSFETKLGPILFQLPPSFDFNLQRLESFLKYLPDDYSYTFEFRSKSWFNQYTYDLLKNYNASLCIYNLAGYQSPEILTADFAYIRMHGTIDIGSGKYSDKELKKLSENIETYKSQGKSIYCYFNNDGNGNAVLNALLLKKYLDLNKS